MWQILRSGGDTGTTVIEGSDGVRRIYAYKSLRLSPEKEPYMYFVLGVPEYEVMASARSELVRNLALIFLVFLLTLGIAWVLADLAFAKKLRAVIAATNFLHAGDFGSRTGVPADGSDLGRVAEALDRMAEKLEIREAERIEAERAAERSLEEKETMLREIHHRVKNNLQVILSLVRLQGNAEGSAADFSKLMETRISAMALVHEMLYRSEDLSRINMEGYVRRLAELVLHGSENPASVELSVTADILYLKLERAIPFALALNELMANAVKHAVRTDRKYRIALMLTQRDESIILRVEDDGPGLPADFNPAGSRGLGMQLILGLAHQLGGSLSWENAGGAAFILQFPAKP
jgi:two-component sensor histidine kinase